MRDNQIFLRRSCYLDWRNALTAIGLKEAFMASGVWQHIQLLHEFDVDAAIAAAKKDAQFISRRGRNPEVIGEKIG